MQLWILGSAVGCFCAGMSAGMVLPDFVAACCRDDGQLSQDERYVRQLAADYGLSSRQQQELRIVMQRATDEKYEVYQHANFDQLPPSMQTALTAVTRRWSDRIRAVLTPEQQVRYDAQVRTNGSVR